MKKYSLIFLCITNSFLAISQEGSKDTMHLKARDLKICFGEFERLTKTGGKYYYNGREIDAVTFEKIRNYSSSVCDSLFSKVAVGKYCKFYNEDSILVQEGTWFPEFFAGSYKEYYENGKLKAAGEYAKEGDEIGLKKGKWVYYNKNGKIKKVIYH